MISSPIVFRATLIMEQVAGIERINDSDSRAASRRSYLDLRTHLSSHPERAFALSLVGGIHWQCFVTLPIDFPGQEVAFWSNKNNGLSG